MTAWYLDASAAVKVVADEPESTPLRALVRDADRLLASVVLLAELGAFARRVGADPEHVVGRIEPMCDLVVVTTEVARSAALLAAPADDRPVVRALDAIHVATATVYADGLDGILTYDQRQASVARAVGLDVHAPGQHQN